MTEIMATPGRVTPGKHEGPPRSGKSIFLAQGAKPMVPATVRAQHHTNTAIERLLQGQPTHSPRGLVPQVLEPPTFSVRGVADLPAEEFFESAYPRHGSIHSLQYHNVVERTGAYEAPYPGRGSVSICTEHLGNDAQQFNGEQIVGTGTLMGGSLALMNGTQQNLMVGMSGSPALVNGTQQNLVGSMSVSPALVNGTQQNLVGSISVSPPLASRAQVTQNLMGGTTVSPALVNGTQTCAVSGYNSPSTQTMFMAPRRGMTPPRTPCRTPPRAPCRSGSPPRSRSVPVGAKVKRNVSTSSPGSTAMQYEGPTSPSVEFMTPKQDRNSRRASSPDKATPPRSGKSIFMHMGAKPMVRPGPRRVNQLSPAMERIARGEAGHDQHGKIAVVNKAPEIPVTPVSHAPNMHSIDSAYPRRGSIHSLQYHNTIERGGAYKAPGAGRSSISFNPPSRMAMQELQDSS